MSAIQTDLLFVYGTLRRGSWRDVFAVELPRWGVGVGVRWLWETE